MADADLRDYFAAKAMQGVLSIRLPEKEISTAAAYAYAVADAMLAERKKENNDADR